MSETKNKRIETFVFEFDSQEIFKEFWDKYFPLKGQSPGIKPLGVAIGNKLKEEDKLRELIGNLYDIAVKNYMGKDIEEKTLEEAEKLLGI